MTATLATSPRTGVEDGARLSTPRLLRSEWIKLHSVRSTVWSYAILVVMFIGLSALIAVSTPVDTPTADSVQSAIGAATFGVFFGQLIVAVLGVLVISGEYSTGQIRSTITAAPKRIGALGAKAVVLFISSFLIGLVSTVGAYAVAISILASRGITVSFADPDVARSLIGTAFYIAVVAVFALGVGAVLRSTAGGVAAALGVILLLPIVAALVPIGWVNDLQPYLLQNAGLAISGGPSPLEPWSQLAITVAWPVLTVTLGAVLLKRRDA